MSWRRRTEPFSLSAPRSEAGMRIRIWDTFFRMGLNLPACATVSIQLRFDSFPKKTWPRKATQSTHSSSTNVEGVSISELGGPGPPSSVSNPHGAQLPGAPLLTRL